jgi:hypothetical protein
MPWLFTSEREPRKHPTFLDLDPTITTSNPSALLFDFLHILHSTSSLFYFWGNNIEEDGRL